MATLADLRTYVSRDLRDTGNDTWSVAEVDDFVNQGIDALADVYPKEIVQSIGTISAGVISYSASSFTKVYRLDIFTSAGTYRQTLEHAIGDPNSGWELHGGILYLPPSLSFTAGDTLKAWGYGRYIQLSAATAVTDLDTAGIWAVRVFAKSEAFTNLIADRAKFQQWQENSNNTDVTALALAQMTQQAASRWRREQNRLRRMRKA